MSRVLAALMAISVFLTACTAIVLGQMSDTEDLQIDAGGAATSSGTSGTSSSGSSGQSDAEVVDECNLRYNRSGAQYTYPKTTCSDCIEERCGTQLAETCVDGKYPTGYDTIRACAKNPWQEYTPEGRNSSWACESLLDPGPEVTGTSDTAKIYRLKKCVKDECLKDEDYPPCKKCEVNIEESANDTLHFLKDDACGKCFTDNCGPAVIKCCGTYPVNDFVQFCAFTDESKNKQTCKLIQFADAGAGPNKFSYRDADYDCLGELRACWNAHCASKNECK